MMTVSGVGRNQKLALKLNEFPLDAALKLHEVALKIAENCKLLHIASCYHHSKRQTIPTKLIVNVALEYTSPDR